MSVALGAGITACGSDSPSGGGTATTTGGGGGGLTVPTETGTPVGVKAGDTSDTAQYLKLDTASVKAGKVTFTFVNEGTRKHEMIVLKTDEQFDALKVGTDNRVSEDASVGEISETDKGKTVTKTFDLKAGNYVLVCNIEKHYGQGMKQAITVTG